MQVNTSELENKTLFAIEGRIDATTAGDLEKEILAKAQEAAGAVLVDFSDVEYISSAGLRSMLKLAKLCSSKKLPLRLFGMRPNVFEVFSVSGFAGIIRINSDLNEALSGL